MVQASKNVLTMTTLGSNDSELLPETNGLSMVLTRVIPGPTVFGMDDGSVVKNAICIGRV